MVFLLKSLKTFLIGLNLAWVEFRGSLLAHSFDIFGGI